MPPNPFASLTVGTPANDTETYSTAPGTNRLASVVNASGMRSIGYDGRGNTLSETRPGGGSVSVTYDGYGRLLTYARTGELGQDNQYNGLDERVLVTTSDGTVSNSHAYVYDLDHRLIGEYGASLTDPIAETIWLQPEVANDDQPLGGDDGVGGYAPLALASGSGGSAALIWVHGNHLGVPLATTDASGAAVAPTGTTMPGYPGQLRTLADLYYNRYRDYDSSTGRYIQADPIGLEGGSNPYLYADGNPLRFTDPWGLKKVILLDPKFDAPFYLGALKQPERPGYCTVFGHMAPGVVLEWRKGKLAQIWSAEELHSVLMAKGCKPHEPVILFGCNAGRGDDNIAADYARLFGVPVVAATNYTWFSPEGDYTGIYGYISDTKGDPGYHKKNLNDPGKWKVFRP